MFSTMEELDTSITDTINIENNCIIYLGYQESFNIDLIEIFIKSSYLTKKKIILKDVSGIEKEILDLFKPIYSFPILLDIQNKKVENILPFINKV